MTAPGSLELLTECGRLVGEDPREEPPMDGYQHAAVINSGGHIW
jgi:hypothetical protein